MYINNTHKCINPDPGTSQDGIQARRNEEGKKVYNLKETRNTVTTRKGMLLIFVVGIYLTKVDCVSISIQFLESNK